MKAIAFALVLVGLVACKQADGGNYSCWMGKVCEDYSTELPMHEKACNAVAGEWEKHTCPSENVLGTCVTQAKQPRIYYGGAANAYNSDTASAACEHELHGTWTSVKP